MNHISESTHLLMINAAEMLAEEIIKMASQVGCPLSYQRMAMVGKSLELVRVARAEARAAGINVGAKGGRE